VRVAFPAVLELANDVLPPKLAMMVALPALLLLLKVVNPRKLAVRGALPAGVDPRKVANPRLASGLFALPRGVVAWKIVDRRLVVVVRVALAGVLELKNCVTAVLPPLVMIALPAVLLLVNANNELADSEKLGVFEELLTMPAPVNVRRLADARLNE